MNLRATKMARMANAKTLNRDPPWEPLGVSYFWASLFLLTLVHKVHIKIMSIKPQFCLILTSPEIFFLHRSYKSCICLIWVSLRGTPQAAEECLVCLCPLITDDPTVAECCWLWRPLLWFSLLLPRLSWSLRPVPLLSSSSGLPKTHVFHLSYFYHFPGALL